MMYGSISLTSPCSCADSRVEEPQNGSHLFSAVLIDKLKSTFNFIKQHYCIINKICGALLIVIGILMATGTLGSLLALLS